MAGSIKSVKKHLFNVKTDSSDRISIHKFLVLQGTLKADIMEANNRQDMTSIKTKEADMT